MKRSTVTGMVTKKNGRNFAGSCHGHADDGDRLAAANCVACKIPHCNCVGQRPPAVAERMDFGHWKGDLVIFHKQFGKSNLTSLVERKSRFVSLWRNLRQASAGVTAELPQHPC